MRTPRTALSAASLLLLLGLLGACGEDESPDPEAESTATTATTSPTATTSSTPSATAEPEPTATPPAAGTTTLTTKGLAQGPAPAVGLLTADPSGTWSLVRPSGEQVDLAVSRPLEFATLGDGLVVIEDGGDEGAVVSLLDGSGAEKRREEARGYQLAVTADRSIVAWLGADLAPRVLEDGGERTFTFQTIRSAGEMGAILGRETCDELASDVAGCMIFVNSEESTEAFFTDSHGQVASAGSMLSVSDAAEDGRVIGLVSVTDQGSCSGVYVGKPKPVWQTCDHTLTSFSPDGTRVLGTDAYLDGFGQRSVAILDSEGTPLHQFTSKGRGPSVVQTAWEDEDHVLAVVFERGRWSVVRLGSDGSAELAMGPLAGNDLDRPFVLEQD